MRLTAWLLLLCAATCVQAQKSDTSVTRVVKLLQDMRTQTDSDAKADEEAYKKYECWCETSKKQKTEAVEVAQQTIAALEASIEKAAGLEAQLKTEIEELTVDIADDEESLEKATALREKENEEFKAVEAELSETLATLKEALAVLAKVQLVQKGGKQARSHSAQVKPLLMQLEKSLKGLASNGHVGKFRSVMQQDLWDMLSTFNVDGSDVTSDDDSSPRLRASPRRSLSALERQAPMEAGEEKPNEMEGNAAGARSYNSRTGSIYGLLEEMKDEFSRDLESTQKAEQTAQASFDELKAAKLGEIAAATAQKKQKEQTLASTVAQAAKDKEDIEATTAALTADEQVLLTLDKNCKEEEDAFASRQKVRSEELVALSEAIAILTSDDARDLFGKTVTKTLSFLQEDQHRTVGADKRTQAAGRAEAQTKAVETAMQKVLQTARRHKDWSLATLAVRMSLDPFTKVKEAMDKMLAELKAQQKEEYERNEFCKKEIDETEDNIKVKDIEKSDLDEKKLGLENNIAILEADVKELTKEIAELHVGLKQAGEDRKAENLVFQKEVSENRQSSVILQKAFTRLEMFYMGNSSFVQTHGSQEPGAKLAPPPPKPSDYKKSGGAGGVLQLLSQIMNDLKRAEAALIVEEQNAQKGYEAFAKDTAAAVDAKTSAITEKTALLESAKGEVSATSESLLGVGQELESLDAALSNMHADCDFLLKYFTARQTARQEEMAAIVEAKAILSGADFSTAEDEADEVASR